MNEAQTELDLIDPALDAAGWRDTEGAKIHKQFPIASGRITGKNMRSKPLRADYVLQYRNRYIGVIEGKASNKYYTEGVGQAKNYAFMLNIRFAFATNGHKSYRIDMQEGSEGDISKFPTPDELWEMTFPKKSTDLATREDLWKDRMLSVPYETKSGTWRPRYYQENAVTAVLDSLAEGKKRILLTLATGTGKTDIAFQIAWKLYESRWNLQFDGKRRPRILFLADRNLLADQAFNKFNSFNAFEENALVRISPGEISKKQKPLTNGNMFYTIFQTFMAENIQPKAKRNKISAKATDKDISNIKSAAEPDQEYTTANMKPNFGQYPKDFFDLIIIDECHRGGSNDESTWRGILEYFSPAVQLGLTATPKREVNKDTYLYFGDPVYVYSLKQGINDGFLTPFKVKAISTTEDVYKYTSGDTVLQGEIDEEREYGLKEQNRIIIIPALEEYRVKVFLDKIDQDQKTLVFCATQKHAAMVRDFINQHARSKNPDYCQRVTANDGAVGEQHLKNFQDNERTIPTILTTSQKLSTGVDAPEIRNIILMRTVNSIVEFKQIIGRGTRLYEGKPYFTLYDFYKAHEHFSDPEWDGEPIEPEICKKCGKYPCECEPVVCIKCGQFPCICIKEPPEPCPNCHNIPCICDRPDKTIKVMLSDNKVRELDSMVKTRFYSPDGKTISAEEFIRMLFGDLPGLFRDEEELRKLWSSPVTRKQLLEELNNIGYTADQLEDLSKLVHGEDSDLFDVLNYIAYHREMIPRKKRADQARKYFNVYSDNQRDFLDFVLKQYISIGFDELDDSKLPELLTLKYQAIGDAQEKLGEIKSIRETFISFQEHLYRVA